MRPVHHASGIKEPVNRHWISIREALLWGSRVLRNAQTDNPRLEAATLLAALLRCDQAALIAHGDDPLAPEMWTQYQQWVFRRSQGEPLAYILGYQWFYGLKLHVTPDVLIPRPETETLVEVALADIRALPSSQPRVVDVGTGSGAIALAIAAHAPRCWVLGTDISPRALRVAAYNARALRIPIHFAVADLLTPLRGPFDLIAANLPYVGYEEADILDPAVRLYEPPEALWGGTHGLEIVARLVEQVPRRLAPKGVLLLEMGYRQGQAMQELLREAFPNAHVTVYRDLAGHQRVVRVSDSPPPATPQPTAR